MSHRECCGRRTNLDHARTCLTRRRPEAIEAIAEQYGLSVTDAGRWLAGAVRCALKSRTRQARASMVLTLELRDTCPQVVSDNPDRDAAWGLIR